MKKLVKTLSAKFPTYKFTICRHACFCDLMVKIKPVNKEETFAYYGGDDCGYIVDNRSYYSIADKFQTEFAKQNIRVNEFIENSKTMLLEFTQL